MKVAIVGGSFNPPHIGHLILAEEVLSAGVCDRVVFVPAHIPPHKQPQRDPGAELRLEMLRESIRGWPELEVDTCEILRQGISYTVDTLELFASRQGIEGKPRLVIGDDLAPDFLETWKNPARILELADILVAHRLRGDRLELPYPHHYLDNVIVAISSTMVRERVSCGGAWRSLVTPGVRNIIETYGLYKNS